MFVALSISLFVRLTIKDNKRLQSQQKKMSISDEYRCQITKGISKYLNCSDILSRVIDTISYENASIELVAYKFTSINLTQKVKDQLHRKSKMTYSETYKFVENLLHEDDVLRAVKDEEDEDEQDIPKNNLKESFFKCKFCKSRNVTYIQKQTRSADEAMTIFITCQDCSKRSKI